MLTTLFLVLPLAVSGCDDGGTDPGDASLDAHHDAGRETFASIVVDPPTAVLTVVDDMPTTQQFQVFGVRANGTRVLLSGANWSVSNGAEGFIEATGLFTASGTAGGVVTVRAAVVNGTMGNVSATATLTVRVERTLANGAPPDAATHFAGTPVTDPARAPQLVYPLDGAAMPSNVPPFDVQWAPTNGMFDTFHVGDVFRVRIAKPNYVLTAYVPYADAMFHHDWVPAADRWPGVTQSDPAQPATITVDRWDSTMMQVVSGNTVSVRFIPGTVEGAVYYWNLGQGHIERINGMTAMREQVVPNPPASPTDATNHCTACHAVSRNGRMLSVEMWGGNLPGGVFDLSADLSTNPSPTVFPIQDGLKWLFSTFNPDNSRLLINGNGVSGTGGSPLRLIDPRNGMMLPATGLPTDNTAHPDWSPDGSHVAFITFTDGPWAVDYTHGSLTLLTAGAGDAFTDSMTLNDGASLSGASEGGAADSHPTWSPDSHWIAFAHGTHSRSLTRDAANNPIPQPGALYLISRDGGAPVRLDRANGGTTGHDSFWPTFSPFSATDTDGAGYFFLAFYSTRGYGNALAGAPAGRRQLWVTAVRSTPQGTMDPSGVPYWLPGQDASTDNMAAFWTQLPPPM